MTMSTAPISEVQFASKLLQVLSGLLLGGKALLGDVLELVLDLLSHVVEPFLELAHAVFVVPKDLKHFVIGNGLTAKKPGDGRKYTVHGKTHPLRDATSH